MQHQKEIEELKNKHYSELTEKSSNSEDSQQLLRKFQEEITRIREEITEKNGVIEVQQGKIKEFEAKNRDLDREMENLHIKMNDFGVKNATLEEKLQKESNIIEEKNEFIENLERNIENLQSKITQNQAEIEILTLEKSENLLKIDNLLFKTTELSTIIEALKLSQSSTTSDQSLILSLKSLLSSKESEITQYQSNLASKTEEISNLQNQLDFSSEKLHHKKSKAKILKETLEIKSRELHQLELDHETILNELSLIKSKQVESLSSSDNINLLKKLEQENQELQAKTTQNTMILQEKNQEISDKKAEIDSLQSKLELQDLDLQELKTKLQVFTEQISQYQTSLEEKSMELISVRAKAKALTESLQENTKETQESKEYKAETDKHINNLEQTIAELSSEISTLHYQLELRECEKNSLETQLNTMTKCYEKLLLSSKEKLCPEDLETHEKELKKIRCGMEKRGSFGEFSNIIGETSEIIRDIEINRQGNNEEENTQKLRQEIKLKEDVLLRKTEEFHLLQKNLEMENQGLKEEIQKYRGWEEYKEKYQSLEKKYNALEKDFITAKVSNLFFYEFFVFYIIFSFKYYFFLIKYSTIGLKMMGILRN